MIMTHPQPTRGREASTLACEPLLHGNIAIGCRCETGCPSLIVGNVHDGGAAAPPRQHLDALVSPRQLEHQALVVLEAEVGAGSALLETRDLLELSLDLAPRHVLLGCPAGDPDDGALGLRQ